MPKVTSEVIAIPEPKIETIPFRIIGTAPYVQCAFSQKAREEMERAQTKPDKKREPKKARNFEEDYRQALHVSTEGWYGIPAPAFRAGMISACRLVGFAMTQAKLAVFVVPDGFDVNDGTPLVKIIKGEPAIHKGMVRLTTGVADIRWRPMWQPGWEATVVVQFDAGMFQASDIANLLMRVGLQVGVGEGRPDSKKSTGMGWGTFKLASS